MQYIVFRFLQKSDAIRKISRLGGMLLVVDTNKICCAFVYNHKHDNRNKLSKIYGHRFNHIYHLIPFYDGNHPDVIPIFESSYTFQGYFAHSYKYLYQDSFSHYMFIADDLILHPCLNETNLLQELTLDGNSGYIKNTSPLTLGKFEHWGHSIAAIQTFFQTCHKDKHVITKDLLPSCEQAKELFRRHGITIEDITAKNIEGFTSGYLKCTQYFMDWLIDKINTEGYCSMPYPLVGAYSDFIIIPKNAMQKFCYYCGIFAAMGLFVEVAIPTAMLLACQRVVTERDVSWHGTEMWDPQEVKGYSECRDYGIQQLLQGFGPNQLYVHPIKLSMWSDVNV